MLKCADCGAYAQGHEGQVPGHHPIRGTGWDGPECDTTKSGQPWPPKQDDETKEN